MSLNTAETKVFMISDYVFEKPISFPKTEIFLCHFQVERILKISTSTIFKEFRILDLYTKLFTKVKRRFLKVDKPLL